LHLNEDEIWRSDAEIISCLTRIRTFVVTSKTSNLQLLSFIKEINISVLGFRNWFPLKRNILQSLLLKSYDMSPRNFEFLYGKFRFPPRIRKNFSFKNVLWYPNNKYMWRHLVWPHLNKSKIRSLECNILQFVDELMLSITFLFGEFQSRKL